MLPGCAAWDRLAERNQPASSEHFKPCSLHAGILCFQPLRRSAHKAGLHNDVGIFSWKELPAHRLAAVVRNQLSSRLVWKDTKGDNKVNPDGLHNDCSFGIHEAEWIELCRALILYYFISELVWDHHCSWTCFFFHLLWLGGDADYRAGWNLSLDVKKGYAVTRLLHHMTGNICAKQVELVAENGKSPHVCE